MFLETAQTPRTERRFFRDTSGYPAAYRRGALQWTPKPSPRLSRGAMRSVLPRSYPNPSQVYAQGVRQGAYWAAQNLRSNPIIKAYNLYKMTGGLIAGATQLNPNHYPAGWTVFCDTGVAVQSCATIYANLDAVCPVGGGSQSIVTLDNYNASTDFGQGKMRHLVGAQHRYIAEFYGYIIPGDGFFPGAPPIGTNSTYRWHKALQIRQDVANSAPLSAHPGVPKYLKFGLYIYPEYPWPLATVDPEVLPIRKEVAPIKKAQRLQKARVLNPFRVPSYQPVRGPYRGIIDLAVDVKAEPKAEEKTEHTVGHNQPPSTTTTTTGVRQPPRKGEKETKVKAYGKGAFTAYQLANKVFGNLTEFSDLLHALTGALPKKYRHPGHSIQSEFANVYRNWDKIDWKQALINVLTNEIEDRIFGKVGSLSKKASQKAGRNLVGFQYGPLDDLLKGAKPPKGSRPDYIKNVVTRAVNSL